MLPTAFFGQAGFYGPSGQGWPAEQMFVRPLKPTQRDRLRLDRYDEQDFSEVVAAMKAERVWFL